LCYFNVYCRLQITAIEDDSFFLEDRFLTFDRDLKNKKIMVPMNPEGVHGQPPGLPTIYYIYIFGGSCPRTGILPGTKFTLHPSLVLSYIGSITARHSSIGRQLNCGVEQRAPPIFDRATITLGIGPHSSLKIVFLMTLMGHLTNEILQFTTPLCSALSRRGGELSCRTTIHPRD